ncbi:MAG: FAD-dependent oxidoreductase [Terriglobales bacterium]|jgi:NADPH-dependent glutamate synthase beta subunit-like oxidoreductase
MTNQWNQFEAIEGSDYWIRMVKCQHACPVHTNACGYVTSIAEGRYEDAYKIARATNPFTSICGRVCGAPCEVNCRRGDVDAAVSIRALKRFVTDKFGPESGSPATHHAGCDQRMLPPNRGDYEKIAVVGGGVSGLTVAHDLVQIGYKVTVFESNPEPGGMLTVGVPVFRLPRELVKAEINAILALGVDLKCNMRLGRDFSIASLRSDGFKAIFLGIGLPKGRKLNLPGGDREMVYDGMDFLRAFNEGKPLSLGRRVVVIGGGNVAYDVARSAVRPEMSSMSETLSEMGRGEQVAYDVARSALRMSSDKEVHVVCLESRAEMPADEVEIVEGEEEGLKLHDSRGPREILGQNGTVTGLRTARCTSVFDATGRFNPSFDEKDVEDIPADTIIFAIGQTSDLSFLKPEDGVESERGLIKVNRETYQTTAPDVFACGDIAHGPRLFIDAIASAQVAARSMHDFLRGTRTEIAVRSQWAPAIYTMAEGWERTPRSNPPVIDAAQRSASLDIIEESYPPAEAHRQAARCLRCNINTVFDTSTCIACNGCVDVCPQSIIKLVGLSELCKEDRWLDMVSTSLAVPRDELRRMNKFELDSLGGVMLKDESTCIRCAMCASRCPTHAITMKKFEFYRECVTVPTPNEKILYHAAGTNVR